jgi:hypothetical protein
MVAGGFQLEHLDDARWRAMPPIVRPLVIGRAGTTEHRTPATSSLVDANAPTDTRGAEIDG